MTRVLKADCLDQVGDIIESLLLPGKLAGKMLSTLTALSSCERGIAFVLAEGGRLNSVAQVGFSDRGLEVIEEVCRLRLPDLYRDELTVYVPDTRCDERFQALSAMDGSGILSFACLPLRIDGNLFGVLYLDSTVTSQLFSAAELERVVKYSRLISHAIVRELRPNDVDIKISSVSVNDYLAERSIGEIEKQQLVALLERHNWNVTRTALVMEVPRRTLYNKMAKHGIKRPHRRKLWMSASAH